MEDLSLSFSLSDICFNKSLAPKHLESILEDHLTHCKEDRNKNSTPFEYASFNPDYSAFSTHDKILHLRSISEYHQQLEGNYFLRNHNYYNHLRKYRSVDNDSQTLLDFYTVRNSPLIHNPLEFFERLNFIDHITNGSSKSYGFTNYEMDHLLLSKTVSFEADNFNNHFTCSAYNYFKDFISDTQSPYNQFNLMDIKSEFMSILDSTNMYRSMNYKPNNIYPNKHSFNFHQMSNLKTNLDAPNSSKLDFTKQIFDKFNESPFDSSKTQQHNPSTKNYEKMETPHFYCSNHNSHSNNINSDKQPPIIDPSNAEPISNSEFQTESTYSSTKINDIRTNLSIDNGSTLGRPRINRSHYACSLCQTKSTPQWRYLDLEPVCNACYMRARKMQRTITDPLKGGKSLVRNKPSHFKRNNRVKSIKTNTNSPCLIKEGSNLPHSDTVQTKSELN